jgi:alpha-tubulin suppressor-like RCC1 family protein
MPKIIIVYNRDLSNKADILSWQPERLVGGEIIDNINNTISVTIDAELQFNLNFKTLFTLSAGATAIDFATGLPFLTNDTVWDYFHGTKQIEVTAENGITKKIWSINIANLNLSNLTDLNADFSGKFGTVNKNAALGTIQCKINTGVSLSSINSNFWMSIGASLKLGNTTIMNWAVLDYTSPVTLRVTAMDRLTVKDWILTLTNVNNQAEILTADFTGKYSEAVINSSNQTIQCTINEGISLASIISAFTVSEGASIKLNGLIFTNNSIVDYTSPVIIMVIAEDGVTSKNWTITLVNRTSTVSIPASTDVLSLKNDLGQVWQVSYTANFEETPALVSTGYVNSALVVPFVIPNCAAVQNVTIEWDINPALANLMVTENYEVVTTTSTSLTNYADIIAKKTAVNLVSDYRVTGTKAKITLNSAGIQLLKDSLSGSTIRFILGSKFTFPGNVFAGIDEGSYKSLSVYPISSLKLILKETVQVLPKLSTLNLKTAGVDGKPGFMFDATGALATLTTPYLHGVDKVFTGRDGSIVMLKDGTIMSGGNNKYADFAVNIINNNIRRKMNMLNVKKFIYSGGGESIFILFNDGAVKSIGLNTYGQLMTGNLGGTFGALRTLPFTNVKDVACGANFTIILFNDGTLKSAGGNTIGQLGMGNLTNYNGAVCSLPFTNVKKVASNYCHTFLLFNDGSVKSFGYNGQGQLGKGNKTNYYGVVQTPSFTNVKDIACGYYHTIILFNNGTIKSFGENGMGQLGMGNITNYGGAICSPAFTNVERVICGENHTFLILSNGDTISFGDNTYGSLGIENKNNVLGAIQTPSKIKNVVDIVCGGYGNTFIIYPD